MQRRWKLFATIASMAVLADQLTKLWARHALPVDASGRGIRVPVIHHLFDLVLAFNTGSAFSLIEGVPAVRVILTVVGLAAVCATVWMVGRTRPDQPVLIASLALMTGGALGNLIDRVGSGEVTDFVLWRWNEHTWPVFNLADACLTVAVGILTFQGLLALRRAPKGLSDLP